MRPELLETDLTYVLVAAFALLGVAIAAGWLRSRDPGRGLLALAIVLFSVVVVLGEAESLPGVNANLATSEFTLIGFSASGFALLVFRHLNQPYRRGTFLVLTGATLALVTTSAVLTAIASIGNLLSDVAAAAGSGVVAMWMVSVAEPTMRFWLAARRSPPVQRARLRALSLGFGGLALALGITVFAYMRVSSPVYQIVIEVGVLALVPVLYASFSPPAWLRRLWRASVEGDVIRLLDQLLMQGGQRVELARLGLLHAIALIGAQSGFVTDDDGTVLASEGLPGSEVEGILAALEAPAGGSLTRLRYGGHSALRLPLRTASGAGSFVLLGHPLTTVFGGDEEQRLKQYAVSFAGVLESARARADLEASYRELALTNQRLEEASRHKSVFLANMSHELRTPLNAIIGFSELLLDDGEGTYSAEARADFLTQIHTSGQHLLGLINDVLDLSKVEAGHMDLHLESVDVGAVIRSVEETVRPLVLAKGQRLTARPGESLTLRADQARLRQMLLNLVSNAVKFTPDGGDIEIAAEVADGWAAISVSDTGVGIAEADLEKIFLEFQQLDSAANRRQQGTGLGLALTLRLAELHGGRVSVESELGRGSRFTLQIPASAAVQAWEPVEARHDRPLVLVVEDNPQAVQLLSRHLARGGYSVASAREARQAVAMARELRPVAITLDVLLPGVDGWEVLKELRRDPSTHDIPVVVVSVVDEVSFGRALGATDYLVKPVDGKDLLAKLDQYVGRSRAPGRSVLLIDDEPANLDLLEAILAPAGYEAIRAGGGREGIDLARRRSPAAILLDLVMPDVDGFDVVEALRADATTRAIPILVITAKELSSADRAQLGSEVAGVFSRDATSGADLVEWLGRALPLAAS